MNRSAQLRIARIAGGVVMLAAVVPAFTAGAALAADNDAPAATTVVSDEVGIGTAVKIGNPDVVETSSADTDSEGRDTKAVAVPAADMTMTASAVPDGQIPGTDSDEDNASADPEATPSDAEVIETDSVQNATPDPETSVLGTKVGNELAETGSDVTGQLLVAVALIALGLGLRFGPQLTLAAARRRH